MLKWITHTTDDSADSRSPLFQLSWTLLHLFAALNCIAIVLHLLSVQYHAQRIIPPKGDQ
jgi:hypothetical protein